MFNSFLNKAKIIKIKVLMVRHIEWLPAGSNKKIFVDEKFYSFRSNIAESWWKSVHVCLCVNVNSTIHRYSSLNLEKLWKFFRVKYHNRLHQCLVLVLEHYKLQHLSTDSKVVFSCSPSRPQRILCGIFFSVGNWKLCQCYKTI